MIDTRAVATHPTVEPPAAGRVDPAGERGRQPRDRRPPRRPAPGAAPEAEPPAEPEDPGRGPTPNRIDVRV
jgi:hypothetical protein